MCRDRTKRSGTLPESITDRVSCTHRAFQEWYKNSLVARGLHELICELRVVESITQQLGERKDGLLLLGCFMTRCYAIILG